MKKLGLLIAVFGVFALVGVASASTADTLQPASTITYNEEVVVNDTLRANSAYIGSTEAGVGGVTFFNGTIVNLSVDDDGEDTIPVTYGDDVRIDGRTWRGEAAGPGLGDDMQFIVNDDMQVTGDLTVDGNLLGSEILTPTNLAVNTDPSDGYYLMYDDGNFTWAASPVSGDISVDTITAAEDINQGIAYGGAVKAMAEITGDATVAVGGDCLAKSWTFNDTTPTCVKTANGVYTLTFDSAIDVDSRYYSATVMDDIRFVRASAVNNVVTVNSYDDSTAAAIANVMFVVY